MPYPQPLIDLGIAQATNRAPQELGEEMVQKLTAIFSDLIAGTMNLEQATAAIAELNCDPKAVVRVTKILATSPAATSGETLPVKEPRSPAAPQTQHRQRSSPWTAEEDDRLLAGIYHFGLSDWQRVSNFVGNGRSRAQCGQRWLRCLDPNMKKDKWSPEEDQQLLRLVQSYGPHSWSKISKEMVSRTDVQCRYRYTHHLSEMNQQMKSGLSVRAPTMPFRPWPTGQVLPPADELKFDEIKPEDTVDVEPKPETVVKPDDAAN